MTNNMLLSGNCVGGSVGRVNEVRVVRRTCSRRLSEPWNATSSALAGVQAGPRVAFLALLTSFGLAGKIQKYPCGVSV